MRDGPKKGTRVLAAEEDVGRALVQGLEAAQRERAVLSATAPADIVTSNTRKAAVQESRGLPWSAMTTAQRGMLLALIEEYASVMPRPIARERLENGANHIHAVWRDFDGDFGVDLLAEHHRNSPHHEGEGASTRGRAGHGAAPPTAPGGSRP